MHLTISRTTLVLYLGHVASAYISPTNKITSAPVKPDVFTKDFTRPMSIPQEGIDAAVKVMQEGRLFRYSATSADASETSQAEAEFAKMVQQKYALGVNSCSSAIMLALMAVGVKEGDEVITNGFTFTALPSTIMRIGAEPVLVETTMKWTMDLDDLEKKAAESNAKVLLLSHMRGKICDMDRVVEICEKHGLTLIEDCAHTCGVTWRGKQIGYMGRVAAYSTQSDKVINSGEGGFVTTDDDEIAAKILYLSGCYERRYGKHVNRPSDELCEAAMLEMPNLSTRMNEVTAAMMRPLIRNLPERVEQYNKRYNMVVEILEGVAGDVIEIPGQLDQVGPVGDHLNFFLKDVTPEQNKKFQMIMKEMGIPASNFASNINARYHKNWRKFGAPHFDLPQTDSLLASAYDLKMPPYFEDEDFPHLAHCIAYAANAAVGNN